MLAKRFSVISSLAFLYLVGPNTLWPFGYADYLDVAGLYPVVTTKVSLVTRWTVDHSPFISKALMFPGMFFLNDFDHCCQFQLGARHPRTP